MPPWHENQVKLALHRVLVGVSQQDFLVVVLTLLVKAAPVLGEGHLSHVSLQSQLELQQLLQERRSHLKPGFLRVQEFEGLDEAPAVALHEDNQGCNHASVFAVEGVYKHTLEVSKGRIHEGVNILRDLIRQVVRLKSSVKEAEAYFKLLPEEGEVSDTLLGEVVVDLVSSAVNHVRDFVDLQEFKILKGY